MNEVTGHNATPDEVIPPAGLVAEARARSAVEPLTRMIAEQQHQLVSQAETIGTLRAELAALRSVDRAPLLRRWRSWLAAGLVVAVVGSASCQASASTKHVGLCARARDSMDARGSVAPDSPISEQFWSNTHHVVDIASKTC